MDIILPQNISTIISIINNGGYTAHIVGGCVRDMLTGRVPMDWDITTNATCEDISALFEKTYLTGAKHGTITVSYHNTIVEVTTWRRDSTYSDHRHPDSIKYAGSLIEDLARRDFTMNAIAYHPDEGIIDPYNGSEDIEKKLIRCVGNPFERFKEDALRMLRAIRFSAQLDFEIEENTYSAIKKCHEDVKYISAERIQAEINKILESDYPDKLRLLWGTGLSTLIFPEINNLPDLWIGLAPLITKPEKKVILLSLLIFTSFEKEKDEIAEGILKRFRYDNLTIREVLSLIRSLEMFDAVSERNLRMLTGDFSLKTASNTIYIKQLIKSRSDTCFKTINPESLPHIPEKISLSGLDLKKAGFNGSEISLMLSVLRLCLYEKPLLDRPDILMAIANEVRRSSLWG